MTKVIMVGGEIENNGWDWDYQEFDVAVINNPFPGPMTAPEDWDFQVTYEKQIGNPLPEGATFEDIEVFIDGDGRMRPASKAAEIDLAAQIIAAKAELSDLALAVNLGEATDAEKARASELRQFIKDNPSA